MTDPINLREIAGLPTHGDQKCPLTGVQGIPYIAITPEERDALVAAVRAAGSIFDGNIIAADGAGLAATVKSETLDRLWRALARFTDEEAGHD